MAFFYTRSTFSVILCFLDGGLTVPSVPPTPASVPLPSLPPGSGVSGGLGADAIPAAGGGGDDGTAVSTTTRPTPDPQTPEAQTSGETESETERETDRETDGETEEEKAKRLLYCSLCKVAVNSPSQLEAHNSGESPHPVLGPLQSPERA